MVQQNSNSGVLTPSPMSFSWHYESREVTFTKMAQLGGEAHRGDVRWIWIWSHESELWWDIWVGTFCTDWVRSLLSILTHMSSAPPQSLWPPVHFSSQIILPSQATASPNTLLSVYDPPASQVSGCLWLFLETSDLDLYIFFQFFLFISSFRFFHLHKWP